MKAVDLPEIEKRLTWFMDRMRAKMAEPKNLAKGDWRESDEYYCLQRMEQELDELKTELFDVARPVPERIIKECSDVANFAFMLADWVKAHPEHFAG